MNIAMSLRFPAVIRAILVLAAIMALALALTRQDETESTGFATAIDGDSLRLNGVEMRLKGLDAPELAQSCRRSDGLDWPCGRAARAALGRQFARGLATCIGQQHDLYGRLLVTCRVLGADINAEMVRQGHAVAYGLYGAEESAARADARGVWSGSFQRPAEWRKAHPREPGR
jgi:endonuclease YncB( thermonuclease family)